MSYNSAVQESTSGYTSFFLSRGQEMRLPIDLMIPTEPPDMQYKSTEKYSRLLPSLYRGLFEKPLKICVLPYDANKVFIRSGLNNDYFPSELKCGCVILSYAKVELTNRSSHGLVLT